MHVTIIVSTAVEKLTRIHKRIFRKLWKFPFSTRLNKSVIYIYLGRAEVKRKIQTNSRNGRISPFPPLNMWQEARKYPKILGSGEERERERIRITRQVVGDWPWEIFVSPRFVRAGVRVPQRWSEVTSRTHERSHCHPPRCAAITNAFQTRNRRVLSSLALPRPPTSSAFSFLLILSLYIYICILRVSISNTINRILFHFPRVGKYRRCYFENVILDIF